MAEETPVEYEDRNGEVKDLREADLIGSSHDTRSHGVSTNVVELGYHPGEGSDEGGCSHSKDEEEADPSDRTILHAPPALPVFGVDLTAAGHKVLSFMDGNAGYNQIFMAPEYTRLHSEYQADTSIASVVVQLYEGVERVVFYLSRRMWDAETRYPEVEKLCLCLVFTYTKLHHILLTAEIFVICKSDVVKHMLSAPC
ncbi:hypothetical protein QYE76_041724 [Lolium multiflorum]|uniref:Reverse transcriptase RNase H-like domain-containing protein n=1 Tax=Lolium multiflorum TaxID=4521 RepID=A0AAD8TFY3_LOLMU|nr:hypothetical protein QYE76_041724 [Lolium multiflorum]